MHIRSVGCRLISLLVLFAVVPPARAFAQCPRAATDNPCPGLKDSLAARSAIQQYLDALAARHYQRAAWLFVGKWRYVAAHYYERTLPDTLTLAGFLQDTCSRGFFICDLRLATASHYRFRPPDTVAVSVRFLRQGRPYSWGPCCGGGGGPETSMTMLTVNRDSGYAVVNLPLYLP